MDNFSFKNFMLSELSYQKNGGDIEKTLKKIPKSHKDLLKKYKVDFQDGNSLKGDNQHVGSLDMNRKEIIIASPWNYGREWTILHEIGHVVYEEHINKNEALKEKWEAIVKRTKDKANQNAEELFCHAYANTYAQNKIEKHAGICRCFDGEEPLLGFNNRRRREALMFAAPPPQVRVYKPENK